jgi:uncharacterized protein YndB with AHSA1/START domain
MNETQSIVVEYELPHPPSKVWRALTETGLVGEWLMPNDLVAEVGHRFTFQAPPMPGWDGVVHCEVVEVEREKKLRYAWRGGPAESRLDTMVSWTLTPTGSGTRLKLEHSGFTQKNAFAFDAMSKGWRGKVGERLGHVIARL